ncbi:unnamed protein product [Rhizopus stolonifer]
MKITHQQYFFLVSPIFLISFFLLGFFLSLLVLFMAFLLLTLTELTQWHNDVLMGASIFLHGFFFLTSFSCTLLFFYLCLRYRFMGTMAIPPFFFGFENW